MGESVTEPFLASFDNEDLARILSEQGIFYNFPKEYPYLSTIPVERESSFVDYYVEPQEEGGFVAFSREFPGAVGQGETVEEAIADLKEAIILLKEVLDEDKASQK